MRCLDGIRGRDMERLEAAAELRRGGGRDLALIGLARDAMLRPQEIPKVRWCDITFQRGGNAELVVPLPDGTCGTRPISQTTAGWLAALLEGGGSPEQRIFSLTTSQINRRVASLCAAAGLAGKYASSSPRIGMAQDRADAGESVEQLRDYGRWRGLDPAWGYVERSRNYKRLISLSGRGANG